mmetsp:Transcript_105096/g.192653  ORF Transcript_105096/g.192653 Transcript_105096/m.192653 type:complete len:313 (+) Transcript_105096:547-1485(+)
MQLLGLSNEVTHLLCNATARTPCTRPSTQSLLPAHARQPVNFSKLELSQGLVQIFKHIWRVAEHVTHGCRIGCIHMLDSDSWILAQALLLKNTLDLAAFATPPSENDPTACLAAFLKDSIHHCQYHRAPEITVFINNFRGTYALLLWRKKCARCIHEQDALRQHRLEPLCGANTFLLLEELAKIGHRGALGNSILVHSCSLDDAAHGHDRSKLAVFPTRDSTVKVSDTRCRFNPRIWRLTQGYNFPTSGRVGLKGLERQLANRHNTLVTSRANEFSCRGQAFQHWPQYWFPSTAVAHPSKERRKSQGVRARS